jgi:hypothetical protein
MRPIAIALLAASCSAAPVQKPAPGAIVQLSPAPRPAQTFLNNAKCLAVDDAGAIHVVWVQVLGAESDGIEPQGQIFYARSDDDGATFSAPRALSDAVTMVGAPKIAAAAGKLFVTWHQESGPALQIFLARSDDGGATFAALSAPLGYGVFPAIDAAGATVAIVYSNPQRASGVSEIFLVRSNDGGQTFTPPAMVSSDDGISSWTATLALSGASVHVAWTDERHDIDGNGVLQDCAAVMTTSPPCHEEEYYRRSLDGGVTWGPETRLTFDPAGHPVSSWCPSLAASGDEVHLAYFDQRSGHWEVYHRRSLDGGATWQDETALTELLGAPSVEVSAQWLRPSLALRGGVLALALWRISASDENTWATMSRDGGVTWSAAQQLSSASPARHPAAALGPDGVARFAWYQPLDGGDEMYFRSLP